MELTLDERYKITTDKTHQNFILLRYDDVMDVKTKVCTGEKKWKEVGFFGGHFKWVLHRYVIETVMDLDKVNVDELLEKLDEMEIHIDKVVRNQNIKLDSLD